MGSPNYGSMSHADLLRIRNSLQPNDPRQSMLADYEHQAFAREWTRKHPVVAPLSLMFAIPAYSALKELGVVHARTPGSIHEMAAGYDGMWQGLDSAISGNRRHVSRIQSLASE